MQLSLGLRLLILLSLFAIAPVSLHEAPHAFADADVKVTITRVVELDCNEPEPNETCPNDYYPKFQIDGGPVLDGKGDVGYCCEEDTDFTPNWVHEATVSFSHNPVPIHIELFDQDDLDDDDEIDIAPGPNDDFLDVTFDLNNCTFRGDGLTPQQGAGKPNVFVAQSEGGVDPNDEDDVARIFFTITTPHCDLYWKSNTTDTDGDSLPNGWELALPGSGIDGSTPPDGIADLALNSDPTHKDIFVEVDWMACAADTSACASGDNHSHAPVSSVLADVEAAFANAPVGNIDVVDGITLHAILGEAVRDVPNLLVQSDGPNNNDDFNDIKSGLPNAPCDGAFGTGLERSSSNCAALLAAKSMAYHYMIFGHSYAEGPTSSGNAEGFVYNDPDGDGVFDSSTVWGGDDFIVTLGQPFDQPCIAATGNPCVTPAGRRAAEAATFMHELGHNLGLDHGGRDFINCKPNYLSIMNYTLQFLSNDPARPMDYSSSATGTDLNNLVENDLNENNGVGGPAGRLTVYGLNGNLRTAQANAPNINWNQANGLETSATADINFISTIGPNNEFGCGAASPNQTLNGHDDWRNLDYNFREADNPFAAGGASMSIISELTGETVLLMENPPPDLSASKSVDKATAIGGDTLNYTVTVKNEWDVKALNVSLSDVLPDNSTQTRSLPDLNEGQSNTQTFTYVVPCVTADGAVLKNQASVTGTNSVGLADVNLGNNSSEVSTTVQAPKLTLAKTATASANAGEAITYTLTYANTGTGGATNVTITDTLPAGVYYSKALDLGSGPQPSTVTVNANGTQTLTWPVGALAANSSSQTIRYTARPSLLFVGGESLSNSARLTFTNANGCTYAPLTASASTAITVVTPSRDPRTHGFWGTHPELRSAETLARIQATDQRYDTDGSGALSSSEVTAMLSSGGNQAKVLQMQLLATYFNLATRRINAATAIESRTADRLGLNNVRDAAVYAINTLKLPVNSANRTRYSNATVVLDEINSNKSEVY